MLHAQNGSTDAKLRHDEHEQIIRVSGRKVNPDGIRIQIWPVRSTRFAGDRVEAGRRGLGAPDPGGEGPERRDEAAGTGGRGGAGGGWRRRRSPVAMAGGGGCR